MGSVAAALRERGFTVTGSDENIYPPMSTFLESQGIVLNQGYRPENIPPSAEIIVIGNAITRGNPGSRSCFEPETLLPLAARSAEGILPAWPT
jgi:UDP-N-acetylmuramate: L-alanyl-gamma-D-glutamyl-meso-diaminopimelate ligase